jgi:hypothetical protein
MQNSYFITTDVDHTTTCWQLRNGGSCKSAGGREKAKLSNRGPVGVAQKATKGPC